MTTILALPIPPSINAAYRNVRRRPGEHGTGRVKSRIYRDWIADATAKVFLQKPERVCGDVRVEYLMGPRCRRSDLGNREKCLTDLLVSCGVIEDDSRIVEIVMRWDDKIAGACATVRAA